MTPEALLDIVHKIIEAAVYGFLITLDESGQPNARVMQPFPPEADLTIWFGVSPHSRKVRELRRDSRATVTFYDPAKIAYVALAGSCQIVDDLEERRARWMEEWRLFFTAGPEGDDYALVRFTPERIEVMDFTRQVTPPPFGLAHTDLVRDGDGWRIAESG
ncbi:MAG: pyridoxamine 5'-phosphate oxidase family protein [Chloroflexi bacterium]|nr:pyridoxamine 5'-phosphate oxidase family protein [Chloroflexota bacterium]